MQLKFHQQLRAGGENGENFLHTHENFQLLHHTDKSSSQDSNFTKEQIAKKLNILQVKIFAASYNIIMALYMTHMQPSKEYYIR